MTEAAADLGLFIDDEAPQKKLKPIIQTVDTIVATLERSQNMGEGNIGKLTQEVKKLCDTALKIVSEIGDESKRNHPSPLLYPINDNIRKKNRNIGGLDILEKLGLGDLHPKLIQQLEEYRVESLGIAPAQSTSYYE